MSRRYISRAIEPVLKAAARDFPAVLLTGPRHSGKTTLLKLTFGESWRYASLEAPEMAAQAAADPRGFLARHPPPVIFEEVQYALGLLPYIKERIDSRPAARGQYLMSCSQNVLLAEAVVESLAGRAAALQLLPLSQREIQGRPQTPLPWESEETLPDGAGAVRLDVWGSFLRGGYPELTTGPHRYAPLWHQSYERIYLERDVRSVRQVEDLLSFQNFLHALAVRSDQILNLTEFARELGVATNTVKAWLSVLKGTFQVIALQPFPGDASRRLTKKPKIYFTDVGTLCHLTGLKDPEHAAAGPMGGVIFKTAVLMEIIKAFKNRGEEPRIWFWKPSAGVELGLVVEHGGKLIPIELRPSATPIPAMADSIRRFQRDLGNRAGQGYVIHLGFVREELAPGVTALPFADL